VAAAHVHWEDLPVGPYIIRRLLISVVLLIAATFLSFALVQMLGDPLAQYAARQLQDNPDTAGINIAGAYHRAGLDQPFLERYWHWLSQFAAGDWGSTVNPGSSPLEVKPKVLHALWITTRLVLGAQLLSVVIGVLVGVVSAVKKYSWFDYIITAATFLLFATPIFAIAVLVKIGGISFNNHLQAGGHARWLITSGYPVNGFQGTFANQIYQYSGVYLMPTLCLMAISFANYSRFQRASMLDTLNSDYVRTAKAKGISNQAVIWRHAFRNALIPLVTVVSLDVGAVFSGAIITETVFGWQGMGYILVHYVNVKEPYMILALVMVTAVFIIIFNLIADLLYTVVDPRIRLG